MSIKKTKQQLEDHVRDSISDVMLYLQSLVDSSDENDNKKADKLCYWLSTWSNMLKSESGFNYNKLKKYKRGDILKVDLGFNIGSEEGGLHYCVVVDQNNSIHSPVITVVPLTSAKPEKDLSHLSRGCVYLGDELYQKVSEKFDKQYHHLLEELYELQKQENRLPEDASIDDRTFFAQKRFELADEINEVLKIVRQSEKMKKGSIALINQISTISKIRIYDPRSTYDVLSGIRLSDESLDLIDHELLQMFTKNK